MSIDLKRALAFPTEDPHGTTKIGIGAVVSLFSVLVVPIFICLGFMMETIRLVADGDQETENLPDWSNVPYLLMRGLVGCGVCLGYMILPVTLGMGSFVKGVLDMLGHRGLPGDAAPVVTIGVMGMLSAALFFIAYMLTPLALARLARSGKIGDAFAIGKIVSTIQTHPADYLMAVLVPGILSAVACQVVGMVPVLGVFLVQVVVFYFSLVTAHAMGQFCRQHVPND